MGERGVRDVERGVRKPVGVLPSAPPPLLKPIGEATLAGLSGEAGSLLLFPGDSDRDRRRLLLLLPPRPPAPLLLPLDWAR